MSATTIIINDETPRRQYTASAGQTVFDFPFPFFADGDLEVYLTPTGQEADDDTDLLTIVTDYTVNGADTQDGGEIVLTSGATADDIITILRVVDIDRTADYQAAGDLLAETLNTEQDTEIMISQQLREEADRSLRIQKSDVAVDMRLPSQADRAGTVLAFNEVDGTPQVGPEIADVESLAAITADIATLADIEDGTEATDAIQTVAGISSNVSTVAGISSNVTTVAGNTTNINTVAADLSGDDDIGTVAGSIANVNLTGGSISNVNTTAGSISNVNTVASNISNVNTVGGISSDVTTVAGISANVTTVAGIDSDVTTVAINVADVTNFADVYIGPSASDPTTRTDTSALQAGDLYFNTTVGELRVYSGSQWVSGTAGTMAVQRFSGDASTVAFTLTTAPAGENNTQVYIDGVYQQKDTYSVSGTTLTFSEAPPLATDNIEVVTISTLALGETDASLVTFTQDGTGAVETTVEAKLNEIVSVKDFGAVGDGVTDDTAAIQAALDAGSNKIVLINDNHVFASDISTSSNNMVITGSGSLIAESESGAGITFSGDNTHLNVPVTGNEHKTCSVVSKTTSPDTITVDGSLTFNIGDNLIIKSTDSFQRVIWAGEITNVSGNVLTVSTNTIDGNFADVAATQTVHVNISSTYYGSVTFENCDNPSVGANFSGSSRDLNFYNCNDVHHGNLVLERANLTYQFCYNVVAGSILSKNSRFYGRTIQACNRGTWGDLIAISPLFSGQVLKGLHNGYLGNCQVVNAPIMSIQLVEYPGSTPNTVNPNLQSDALNSNVVFGNLKIENGNWIAAIKNVDSVRFKDVIANSAFKSFYGDNNWDEIECDNLIITNHNSGGSAITSNSSAAVFMQNGKRFVVKNRLRVKNADTGSSNGHIYITGLTEKVHVNVLDIESCESRTKFINNAEVVVNHVYTTDNIDGYDIVRGENNGSFSINKIVSRESVNSTLDRLVYVTGDNIDIRNFDIEYDSSSVTPSAGIRNNSSGTNINISNGFVTAINSASCVQTVQSTGACDHIVIDKVRSGSNVTRAVLISNATDYVQVINCQGTISDTTGALTNKDVSTGNI